LTYIPKTIPWKHQADAFERSRDQRLAALFFEMRTGKTKVVIDTAGYQYTRFIEAGGWGARPRPLVGLDALLVVAMPSGVPANWAEEIETHLPDNIPRQTLVWKATQANTKRFLARFTDLCAFQGLACLLANGEATTTPAFKALAYKFLRRRRALVVADETTLLMAKPGNKRAITLLAVSRQQGAVMRRILDGTPVGDGGPFDYYTQFKFLSPKILGFDRFETFKTYHGEFEPGFNHNTNTEYKTLIGYRNVPELQEKIAPYVYRVRRQDCFDLPPKIYQKIRFPLSDAQREVYDDLKTKYQAEIDGVGKVSAPMVLTRLLRLQQIASNFWPETKHLTPCSICQGGGCEDCDGLGDYVETRAAKPIAQKDPRYETLRDTLKKGEPTLVWARFTRDVDVILTLGAELGLSPVRYDGKASADDKIAAKHAFTKGEAGLLVGNERSGGRGLKLPAKTIIYYTNQFSLLTRLQSEDRAEFEGMAGSTGVLDFIAEDTIDEQIVESHRRKMKVVDYIMNESSGRFL